MNQVDVGVRVIRADLAQALFLRRLCWLAGAWGFLLGTAVLLVRAAMRGSGPFGLIGAGGLLVAVAVALVLSRRGVPAPDVLRAKLDALTHAGGLLAAAGEVDVGAWHVALPTGCPAHVRWHEPRAGVFLAAAGLYALAALLVPVRPAAAFALAPATVETAVDALQEKVEVLAETELIEADRAQQLATQLERLTDRGRADDPMKTWEALDHVADSIRDIAAESSAEVARALTETTALEALGEALEEAGQGAGSALDLTAAMREFAALMEANQAMNALDGVLSPELAQALKKLALDPAQLKTLTQCLGKLKAGQIEKLCKLCEAGMLDPTTLSQCQAAAADGEAALAAFMDAQGDDSALAAVVGQCQMPGQGGVSRGRGDAPLTWTDGTDESGAAFKEEVIPPSALGAVDKSRLTGVSSSAPDVDGAAPTVRGGALSSSSGGGGAHKQQVLPQHRRAVERYFHRGAENND